MLTPTRALETMPLANPKRINGSRTRDDGDGCEPGTDSSHGAGPAASEDLAACRRVSCPVVLRRALHMQAMM